MKSLKYFLLLFLIKFCVIAVNAQAPANDPAWILEPSGTSGGTEEFNAPLDTFSKWYPHYPWGDYKGGAEVNLPSNLISTGTSLQIKVDTLYPHVRRFNDTYHGSVDDSVTIVYQGANLQSRKLGGTDVYKYGFIEIEAKLPQDSIWSLWPAFWIWSAGCSPMRYDEIDICENGAGESYFGNLMGTNWHVYDYGICDSNKNTNNPTVINNLPHLSEAFHKYAIEWGPDRIIFYFDDIPVKTYYDATTLTIPQNPTAVHLNFAIDTWNAVMPSDWNFMDPNPQNLPHGNTNFPQIFEIKYLHYYKLNRACTNNLTICSPAADYSSRAIEQSIKTGGACSPVFNGNSPATSYTLRATNYVTLDAGTTVDPSGTGSFSIELMQCPNY